MVDSTGALSLAHTKLAEVCRCHAIGGGLVIQIVYAKLQVAFGLAALGDGLYQVILPVELDGIGGLQSVEVGHLSHRSFHRSLGRRIDRLGGID